MTGRPTEGVLVRLGAEDARELLTLQRSAYAEQARLHDDPALPPLVQTLAELLAELASPEVTALGLRRGHRLVAAVRVHSAAGADAADLGRLVVAPDLQGQGLGTRLLLTAETVVPESVRVLRLFTGEHSASNLRLYQRHGYRETHRTTVSAHAGRYALIHLAKTLT